MPDAQKIALQYMSPRYQRLSRFERYVDGSQYQGRAPFLSQGDDAPPIHEREPCIVYGIADNAIGDLVDFMMGEGRYPNVSAGSSEDDEMMDDDWGLNEEDSSFLERWINGPLTTAAKLKSVFADALTMAMSSGAVALVAGVNNGVPTVAPMPAKWCTPTFDVRTGDVVSLEVFYPFIVEEPDPHQGGRWELRCKLYRRVIDAVNDIVFLPADGREDGTLPNWIPDLSQSVTHGLGFCPVRWFAFDRKAPTAAHYDGKPLHAMLLDEIDALNLSLSQRHRAALYAGDPQMWETGVEPDANPAPVARYARVQVEVQASRNGQPAGVFTASPRAAGRGSARKKGPGIIWRYTNTESKVGMLTLPDGALGSIDSHAADLRKKLAEDMSVVLLDPTDVKAVGALSGRALAFVFARQVARADRIRQDAGDGLMLSTIDLLMRITLAVSRASPRGVRVPGMRKLLPVLASCEQDMQVDYAPADGAAPVSETVKCWFGPRLELQWGRYFPPTPEEEAAIVNMCATAKNSGLLPDEVILEKLRGVFQFGSARELLERLEEQKAEAQERMAGMADAMKSKASSKEDDDSEDDDSEDEKEG